LVLEEEGKLKLYDHKVRKPLTKAYIKVFAKTSNNNVIFFKDGYSDIRGQFDYATMHIDNNENIQSFVILIAS
jgi:hypothetical protein